MKIFFVILLLSKYINYIISKNPESLTISVYENSYKKDTYNLTLINPKYVKLIKNPSKLAYITDINTKDSMILDSYTKYYNKIWLFFITDTNQINKVMEQKYGSNSVLITGVIIPKSLDYSEFEEIEKFPIFTIGETMNETLINYDIRNNKKNTYFIINFTENLLINFLIIFSAIVLVTAIVIGVGWNYLEKKVGPNYVFAYHDKIKYILCAHIFLSLALIFKTISVMRTENYELTVAVEISLYLSVSFFRSLLWFLIYLISFGWNICFQDLAMSEQRKIFRLFIFIAIFFFIDDILDKYCGKLWVLNISEIKNMLIFGLLSLLTLRNLNKNLKVLERKYTYALTLLQAYADGINEKLKILRRLKYEISSYLPTYIFLILINKTILSDYDNPIILLYIYLIPDFIFELAFIYLMRPKLVPLYYSVDLGDIFNEEVGNTFICVLPKFDEFNEEKMVQEMKDNKENNQIENIPVIVLGPEKSKNNNLIVDEDSSEKSDLLDLDINKYFSNIQVGYHQKSD